MLGPVLGRVRVDFHPANRIGRAGHSILMIIMAMALVRVPMMLALMFL